MYKSVGKEISIISRQFKKYITRELKNLNIGVSEYIFIINVKEGVKINQQNLCDEFAIDKAQATRAIKSLVKKEILIREKNPEDRREYMISLTPKGEALKPIIFKKLRNWGNILEEGTTIDEKEKLLKILERFRQNAIKENDVYE